MSVRPEPVSPETGKILAAHQRENLMNHQPPSPTPEERSIAFAARFGCGGLLGLAVGFLVMAEWATASWQLASGMLAIGLVCGMLTVRYGDDFVHAVLKGWHWW